MSAANTGKFDVGSLKRVLTYARPYRKQFHTSIALSIVLAVLAPVRPILVQKTVNEYISQSLVELLIIVTIIQVVILVLESAIRYWFSFITSWLGQSVIKDLRNNTFSHILRLQLRQYDKTPIGTLTTRTINDIEAINEIFSNGLIPIIADLLSIICILIYMFYTDWQLSLIALIPFPILIFATYIFKATINRSFFRVRNAVAKMNAFVQEHLSGMQVLQAFTAEDAEFEKFKTINKEHRNANIQGIFAYSVFFPVVEIVLAASISLVIWFSAKESLQLTNGQQGVVVSFILCINMLFRPIRFIADKFNVIQMGVIASQRVFAALDNPDVLTETNSATQQMLAQPGSKLKGEISFNNLSFEYKPGEPVLKNLNLTINQGETIAIVGHTGSGKTTIISLLNRLYPISSGSIKIDDTDIEEYPLSYLRKNIAVVLQDVFLFSGSIFDNITLRNPKITLEKVVEAAKLIGIHEFILSLPEGYHYHVLERGATLSLGQRQLISFIRAILFNPAILVLDEATSSVDTQSEMLVQQAIGKLIKGRTSIIIAHRLSTIRKANNIIVLDKGVIKESGSHNDLLQLDGEYAKLYKAQFGFDFA